MKRSLSGGSGTPTLQPSTKHARTSGGGGGAGAAAQGSRGKGGKQLSISAFLCAPAPPQHQQPQPVPTPTTKETPNTHRSIVSLGSSMDLDSGGRTGLQQQGLDWSAQRAFQAFKLGTPADEVAQPCEQEPQDSKTGEAHLLASTLSRPSSAESSEDGFKLFCSQTYQRQSSQVTDPFSSRSCPEDSEDDEQQHLSWSANGSFSQRHSLFAPWIETESHGLPTQPAAPNAPTNFSDFSFLNSQDEQPLTQPMEERTNPEDETCCLASIKPDAGATNAATPELVPTQVNASCSTAEVAHEENTHGQAHVDVPVFNIFRPAKDRKCLLIVRHGESEYNRACSESKSYADPQIFDPQLTAKGHHQCLDLKRRLRQIISEKAPKFGDPLFVVSPLTRTLQTFLESNPYPERLASSASYDATQPPLNIEVLPAISEFMVTPGDVGRPPSHLAHDFPQLAEQLLQLPEVWWYQDPRQPNCALNQSWGSSEPQKMREHRISEFARWLNGRSEQLVVLVGHSSFWHHFTNKSRQRLQNCEVMSMTW